MSIKISSLYLSDNVYLASQTSSNYEIEQLSNDISRQLSNKLDLHIGGSISGDVGVVDANLSINTFENMYGMDDGQSLAEKLNAKQDKILSTDALVTGVYASQHVYNSIYLSTGTGTNPKRLDYPNITANAVIATTTDVSGQLSNYLNKCKGGEVSGAISIVQHALSVLSGNLVQTNGSFVGGEGSIAERSSFAYGTGVSAIGENSYAAGKDSIAGCYGWYYACLSSEANLFYLTETQPDQTTTPRGPSSIDMSFDSGLAVGDVVSFVNYNKYDIGSTIVAISGNAISVDGLPEGGGQTRDLSPLRQWPDHDDWSFFCPSRPLAGRIWLGEASYAAGSNSKAINAYSYAEGKDNVAYGQFSHVEGLDNEAGYASHAEGRNVRVHGQYSHGEGLSTEVVKSVNTCAHAEGRETKALDRYSHAEGYLSEAKYGAHAEGLSSRAYGNYSHAEGEGTYSYGSYSHAEGYNTQAQNQSEHAQGQFNKSNRGTLHSIGFGASDAKRKNAVEVLQNGSVYVYGIGGYDGTNPATAQSLQQVIASLM